MVIINGNDNNESIKGETNSPSGNLTKKQKLVKERKNISLLQAYKLRVKNKRHGVETLVVEETPRDEGERKNLLL